MNPVLESTREIALGGRSVKINQTAVLEWAERFGKKHRTKPKWEAKKHFFDKKNPERSLSYLVMLDTLNFCFWSPRGGRWEFSYRGKSYSGYYALALALKVFFLKHKKANLQTFAEMKFADFERIFQGGRRLMLMPQRYRAARGVAQEIIKLGGILSLIDSAKGKFSNLVPQIARLPSFADEASYHAEKIYFWKRAQILAGDIAGAFAYRGPGKFLDPEYLTAFADYRVPQVLESLKILVYAPKLRRLLQKRTPIRAGSPMELEIRATTIWAVEYMRRELQKQGVIFQSYQIDWLLWQASQKINLNLPHHRTKTVFY